MSVFDSFVKRHDYLICVDSDGCAMDTMNCKHIHCFGPCMITEWALEQWETQILRRWNDVNLFKMTRGINRFKGLAIVLGEVDSRYTPILGLAALNEWIANAPALSNDGLSSAIETAKDEDSKLCLQKALNWSIAVNESISKLPDELKQPFPGAREGLAAAAISADVAVVSSANRDAVAEEWEQFGFLPYVSILLTQDCGSKSYCIKEMMDFGYDPDHILMVGDAPGDCEAAEQNGVFFYPILVNWEEESWNDFASNALPAFLNNEYCFSQAEKKQAFVENLGG